MNVNQLSGRLIYSVYNILLFKYFVVIPQVLNRKDWDSFDRVCSSCMNLC